MRSLVAGARQVMRTADVKERITLGNSVIAEWRAGKLRAFVEADVEEEIPGEPPAPPGLEIVAPRLVPKRGTGNEKNRISLLHSLAHIENVAISLAWDVISRWGARREWEREFYEDFLSCAEDEQRHFLMLEARLQELKSHYGAMSAHGGIWEGAEATSGPDDLLQRLAVENMFLEARGLDVTPKTIEKLRHAKDYKSADLLEVILHEEIRHVEVGVSWFRKLAPAGSSEQELIDLYRAVVSKHIVGGLKGPFNVELRDRAKFPRAWYDVTMEQ